MLDFGRHRPPVRTTIADESLHICDHNEEKGKFRPLQDTHCRPIWLPGSRRGLPRGSRRGSTSASGDFVYDGVSYHGHADSFLVQAGSGVATLGPPLTAPGVPASATKGLNVILYGGRNFGEVQTTSSMANGCKMRDAQKGGLQTSNDQ